MLNVVIFLDVNKVLMFVKIYYNLKLEYIFKKLFILFVEFKIFV